MYLEPNTDPRWFEQAPKVELHLHLEGAIPLPILWDLLQKYGGDPAVSSIEKLAGLFVYRDFAHFVKAWSWKSQWLREYDDFELLAEAVAQDLVRQNVRYAEVFYSPPDYLDAGLEPQRLTAAIRRGIGKVANIEIALVADLVRDEGPERGARLLECIQEVRDLGVNRRRHRRFGTSFPARGIRFGLPEGACVRLPY